MTKSSCAARRGRGYWLKNTLPRRSLEALREAVGGGWPMASEKGHSLSPRTKCLPLCTDFQRFEYNPATEPRTAALPYPHTRLGWNAEITMPRIIVVLNVCQDCLTGRPSLARLQRDLVLRSYDQFLNGIAASSDSFLCASSGVIMTRRNSRPHLTELS
jgi:hypothetical protein